jgi:putative restriction endonuclease
MYLPIWPVSIIEDHPESSVMFGGGGSRANAMESVESLSKESVFEVRKYVAAFVMRCLHQTTFRETVIQAYAASCTLCRLRHRELLDAAHIVPDVAPLGEPIVANGLCLCKIHHAAFDQNIVGIDPEYTIHVRRDILSETDGPMLLHGLQELHQRQIVLPSKKADRPGPARLELRFKEFKRAV